MTERERWIIYPLLFFALGAALRDKFTHEIHTDRLRAGQIICEDLTVMDSEKPDRPVAKLTSNPPQRNGDRFGVLVLIDSENKEFCEVRNNQLMVSQLACKSVMVVDPVNQKRPLALLTATNSANDPSHRMGSLLLSDSEGQDYFGLADDQLKMRQIVCEGLTVVDPKHPERALVLRPTTSAPKPASPKRETPKAGE